MKYTYNYDIINREEKSFQKRCSDVHYNYSAYGECKAITGSKKDTIGVINSFRYKGYYFDEETGFFYCKSRYYVPEWCRWLNADKYLSTYQGVCDYNIYAYCDNSPVVFVDTSGQFPIGILGLVFLAAAVYTAVVACLISDITKEDEGTLGIFKPSENSNALYLDMDVQTTHNITTDVEIDVGLYDETVEVNEYNSLNVDVAKASAHIGYTGFGVGVYLGEVTATNRALNIFGKTVNFTFGANYGVGATFNVGSKTTLGISCGTGFIISFEII